MKSGVGDAFYVVSAMLWFVFPVVLLAGLLVVLSVRLRQRERAALEAGARQAKQVQQHLDRMTRRLDRVVQETERLQSPPGAGAPKPTPTPAEHRAPRRRRNRDVPYPPGS